MADPFSVLEAITAHRVVAVDIPSGADADVMGEQTGAVARADAVVTFTAPRPAHIFGRLTDGPTLIAPIGSPDEAIVSSLQLNLITAREIAPLIGGSRPKAARIIPPKLSTIPPTALCRTICRRRWPRVNRWTRRWQTRWRWR